ncbi:hypothetical protein D3C81_2164420 [compost metagenome]
MGQLVADRIGSSKIFLFFRFVTLCDECFDLRFGSVVDPLLKPDKRILQTDSQHFVEEAQVGIGLSLEGFIFGVSVKVFVCML